MSIAEPLQTTAPIRFAENWSMADLQSHLCDIPAHRIRLYPFPGTATEQDVLTLEERENRLCELEDGVLVEKDMGAYESAIAFLLALELGNFLRSHDLGKAFTTDAPFRLLPGLVKMPNVSFVSWKNVPKDFSSKTSVLGVVPDLAVEVLSMGNTKREMSEKLNKYFEAGVRLVWYVDSKSRSAQAFTSPTSVTTVPESGELDGGDVLPGFRLSLANLFAEADRTGPRPS